MSNPFSKRQIKLNPSGKANKTGYVMFTENGGSILPANATTPGPYPPPTVYSFILAYDAGYCNFACFGSPNTTYYSTSPTLGASSKLYTNYGLTIPVTNGYYSEGNGTSGNCYSITDGLGTIDSVSACVTPCWQYTIVNNRSQPRQFQYTDCNGTIVQVEIAPFSSYIYCTDQYTIDTDGPCTL